MGDEAEAHSTPEGEIAQKPVFVTWNSHPEPQEFYVIVSPQSHSWFFMVVKSSLAKMLANIFILLSQG
jgi:hypothetical protein